MSGIQGVAQYLFAALERGNQLYFGVTALCGGDSADKVKWPAFGMGKCQNDELSIPEHIGDEPLFKLRAEVDAADVIPSDTIQFGSPTSLRDFGNKKDPKIVGKPGINGSEIPINF